MVLRRVRVPPVVGLTFTAALILTALMAFGPGHPKSVVVRAGGTRSVPPNVTSTASAGPNTAAPSVPPNVTSTASTAPSVAAAVQAVFRTALNLHWQGPVPPVAPDRGVAQPQDLQKQIRDVSAQLHQLYAPGASADRETGALNTAVSKQVSGGL